MLTVSFYEGFQMISESIKKQREKKYSEFRRLLIKINGSFQEKSQESKSLSEDSIQTLEDNNQRYNICDCCQRSDIPIEKITQIESSQRLCPTCLEEFHASVLQTA